MRDYFDNKYGYLTIEQFIWLLHNEVDSESAMINYIRDVRHKCPPKEMIKKKNVNCFYCKDCYEECADQVKELKSRYRYAGKHYQKSDFDVDRNEYFK